MNVGILGGGKWGQALARLVIKAGHSPLIAYEGKRPPHVLPSTNNPPVPAACELVLVIQCLASAHRITKGTPWPSQPDCFSGRGLGPETGEWMSQVVQQECDAIRIGALGGPAPVDEI